MTLYRQLVLMVVLMTLFMFAGTAALNLYHTRSFMADQLASRAQDTAASLALSLSPHMAGDDLSAVTALIDAIYDRGYSSVIALSNLDGRTLVERRSASAPEGVPAWFIRRLNLNAASGEADVMAGQSLAAHLSVKSHPDYAYRVLWRSSIAMLYWFVAVAIGVALFGVAVLRVLLRPLRAVEKQAQGICAREYGIQKKLPRTREFRRVVEAMNRMTQTVQRLFQEQSESAEQLRELVYQDTVTGVGNRRYFEGQLRMLVSGSKESSQGALLLVRINGLKAITDASGFEAGDALIEAASAELSSLLEGREAVLGRLSGAEFGIALPNANRSAATGLAERVAARLTDLHRRELTPTHDVGQIGVTLYEGDAKPAALLAEADAALRTAQAAGPNRWAVYEPARIPSAGQALSRQQWVRHLARAVERRDLVLYAQPVVSGQREDSVLHREILFRVKGPDGILCTAGQVMPMVEELGLTGGIDRLVVERVMAWLARQPAPICCAVNLSPDTLRNDAELDWLYQALAALPRTSGRLVFEFSELGVVHELERLKRFSERVRALGQGFALDHFGRAFSNFGYLRSLRPDYVKIDGGFTSAIGESRDDQFFVKTLAGIAHSLDIAIIAQMVETDEQYDVLRGLQIDGVQGYIVGRPEPLEPNA